MRTNIDIDDDVLEAAMKAGGFRTKKDAVEAGLRLLARQAVYRELLSLQGKLQWDGDADDDASPVLQPRGAGTRKSLAAPAAQRSRESKSKSKSKT